MRTLLTPLLLVAQCLSIWAVSDELAAYQWQLSEQIASNLVSAANGHDLVSLLDGAPTADEAVDMLIDILQTGQVTIRNAGTGALGAQGAAEEGRRLQTPPIPRPAHTGLDMDCSNKLCDYMQYELSCKGIGFDLKKICSSYMVGRMYNCNNNPTGQYEVFNAPSVCLQEYLGFVQILSGGTATLTPIINQYLFNPQFSSDVCGRRCYQRFQNYSNDFLLNCQSQLNASKANYPLVYGYSNFQQFRNQVCNYNATGSNCYQSFLAMTSSSTGQPSTMSPFNMYCNYQPSQAASQAVLGQFCGTFSKMGCCAASGMQILFANQQNTTNLLIWPPCLLNYFHHHCGSMNLNDFCSQGSVATQSVFIGWFVLPSSALHYINVYNTTSLVMAQGILTSMFAGMNPTVAQQPYNLNKGYPFSISITGYSYSNSTTTLTPPSGEPAWPAGSDFTASTQGNFTYQVYMQNLALSQVSTFQNMMINPNLHNAVAQGFGTSPASVTTGAATYDYFDSDPIPMRSSAASWVSRAWVMSGLALGVLVVLAL